MAPGDDSRIAVYAELRARARHLLSDQRPGHTLSATALVHEAYLHLGGHAFESRRAFFAAAAVSMRRILIDHARAKTAAKRGGGRRVDLDAVADALELARTDRCVDILIVDEALERLEAFDPDAAELVRLRFFAGLDIAETAEALGTSPATVKREWRLARATLYRLLDEKS
jgi:RNA polymerase sigma factor (TIGR02999 family)